MAKPYALRKEASRKVPGRSISGVTSEKAGERGPARGAAAAAALDRLIHERMRLAILAELAVEPSLSFSELKRHLKTTDGNLSVHARRLEEAGYIVCRKSTDRRAPRTDYSLTPAGRAALTRYLDRLEELIEALRSGPAAGTPRKAG